MKNIRKYEQEIIEKRSECEVAQKIKYLGIELNSKNIDLFKNNYIKTQKKIK